MKKKIIVLAIATLIAASSTMHAAKGNHYYWRKKLPSKTTSITLKNNMLDENENEVGITIVHSSKYPCEHWKLAQETFVHKNTSIEIPQNCLSSKHLGLSNRVLIKRWQMSTHDNFFPTLFKQVTPISPFLDQHNTTITGKRVLINPNMIQQYKERFTTHLANNSEIYFCYCKRYHGSSQPINKILNKMNKIIKNKNNKILYHFQPLSNQNTKQDNSDIEEYISE